MCLYACFQAYLAFDRTSEQILIFQIRNKMKAEVFVETFMRTVKDQI